VCCLVCSSCDALIDSHCYYPERVINVFLQQQSFPSPHSLTLSPPSHPLPTLSPSLLSLTLSPLSHPLPLSHPFPSHTQFLFPSVTPSPLHSRHPPAPHNPHPSPFPSQALRQAPDCPAALGAYGLMLWTRDSDPAAEDMLRRSLGKSREWEGTGGRQAGKEAGRQAGRQRSNEWLCERDKGTCVVASLSSYHYVITVSTLHDRVYEK